MKIKLKIFLFCLVVIFSTFLSNSLFSQIRIAVLPFQNMDGKIEKNIHCYSMQDSVFKALKLKDPEGKFYTLVPADSVEDILASLNMDPSNPQYISDMWKAVKMLNIKKVVMGNFNIANDKFLINAYIYDAKMKLADPKNQIRDIFKSEDQILTCIDDIIKAIIPALIK